MFKFGIRGLLAGSEASSTAMGALATEDDVRDDDFEQTKVIEPVIHTCI
jgi:hypothetical protein